MLVRREKRTNDFFTKLVNYLSLSHKSSEYRHEAELHLVHLTEDYNNTAVVAVLYNLGDPDPLISKVEFKEVTFFFCMRSKLHGSKDKRGIKHLGT